MKQVSNDYAVTRLAIALRRLDAANPDVGMGPGDSHFIESALRELDLTTADINREKVRMAMGLERW